MKALYTLLWNMKVIRMKLVKRAIVIIGVIVLSSIQIMTLIASEASSTINVSYTPDRVYKTVNLELQVHGQGTVYDGDQAIREGNTIVYELYETDRKTLRIEPDKGYKITSVLLDDGITSQDITAKIDSGLLNIIMTNRNASLIIHFSKIDANDSSNGGDISEKKPVNTVKHPATGDQTSVNQLLTIAVTTLFVIYILHHKKKQEEDI